MAPTTQNPAPPAEPAPAPELELPRACLPDHVAIIMDGNGRWAQRRGKPRTYGHQHGAESVRNVVTEAARLNLDVLTLYSFSTENWSRSDDEVAYLMRLCAQYLMAECDTLHQNNVRFRQIGRRDDLPDDVLTGLDHVTRATADNTGLTLVVALNYGSRTEITDAVRDIARKVRDGSLDPQTINEHTINDHLYTADLPDPDLLIRTAGEMRVSNYLLWQISYAEFYSSNLCWPDFRVHAFHDAMRDYARRKRKFGTA